MASNSSDAAVVVEILRRQRLLRREQAAPDVLCELNATCGPAMDIDSQPIAALREAFASVRRVASRERFVRHSR